MAVAMCNRCGRMISMSLVPGGNPVALEDPEKWSTSYRPCPVCCAAYCDRCMDLEPLCPACPGPRKRPSRAHWLERIPWLVRQPNRTSPMELVEDLWEFTREQPTIALRLQDIRTSFPAQTLRHIAAIMARSLDMFSDGSESVYLGMTPPLTDDDPDIVPKEFFVGLARCDIAPDS